MNKMTIIIFHSMMMTMINEVMNINQTSISSVPISIPIQLLLQLQFQMCTKYIISRVINITKNINK